MAQNEQWQKPTQAFLNASNPSRSQSMLAYHSTKEELPLQRSHSTQSLSNIGPNHLYLHSSKIKKIQLKKQDHTIRNVLCITFAILFVIICIDIKNDIYKERHRFKIEAEHCFSEHTVNQCDNPVDVMREKCKELQLCYTTPVENKIKVTAILGNLVGQAVRNCVNSAGLPGTIFLVCMIGAIFFFAYKSSKRVMIIQNR